MNAFTVPPREATEAIACGTHVSVLKALAAVYKPLRVLELGSGLFSTPLFLDRSIFTDLEFLQVVENDPAWHKVVTDQVGDDPRMDYWLVDGEIAPVVTQLDIAEFDLIFCDDSRSGSERCATIRALAPRVSHSALVVVHDYEEQQYQDASRAFNHQFFVDRWNPSCGVCWNGPVDHEPTLQRLRDGL